MTTEQNILKEKIEILREQGIRWRNSSHIYARCEECEDFLPETEIAKINAEIRGLKEGYQLAQKENQSQQENKNGHTGRCVGSIPAQTEYTADTQLQKYEIKSSTIAGAYIEGYEAKEKETAEKVEKLKDKLSDLLFPDLQDRKDMYEIIDKIFKEKT